MKTDTNILNKWVKKKQAAVRLTGTDPESGMLKLPITRMYTAIAATSAVVTGGRIYVA